jgi:hypothetical protein
MFVRGIGPLVVYRGWICSLASNVVVIGDAADMASIFALYSGSLSMRFKASGAILGLRRFLRNFLKITRKKNSRSEIILFLQTQRISRADISEK